MLDIPGLRQTCGGLVAVNDVSFTIEPGQLVGLLGSNGEGKTTKVSISSGLLAPDAGEVRIVDLALALSRFRREEA